MKFTFFLLISFVFPPPKKSHFFFHISSLHYFSFHMNIYCGNWYNKLLYLYLNLWHSVPLIHQATYQIKNMLYWKTLFHRTIFLLHLDLDHVYRRWNGNRGREKKLYCKWKFILLFFCVCICVCCKESCI